MHSWERRGWRQRVGKRRSRQVVTGRTRATVALDVENTNNLSGRGGTGREGAAVVAVAVAAVVQHQRETPAEHHRTSFRVKRVGMPQGKGKARLCIARPPQVRRVSEKRRGEKRKRTGEAQRQRQRHVTSSEGRRSQRQASSPVRSSRMPRPAECCRPHAARWGSPTGPA